MMSQSADMASWLFVVVVVVVVFVFCFSYQV